MTELAPEPASSEPGGTEAVHLESSLAALSGLVAAAMELDDLLRQVAGFAVRAIPGADGAGVALWRLEDGAHRVDAVAASHQFVAEIDQIQFVTANEGPSITAAREGRTVRSGSLGGERLWPRFGARVGRLGVHSVLSTPLAVPGQTVGSVNVYARAKDVFGEQAVRHAEVFAAPAAVAVHNAQVLSEARRLASQLQSALSSRPVIDQAIGLVRGRSGVSAEEAFARLRAISQQEHRKVAEVAAQLVDEAVRRAQDRRNQT